MLRIGKNPRDQESGEQPAARTEAATVDSRSYATGYQPAEPQPRPVADTAQTARAVTESESLARDIKEGTLSGFVGSGTLVTGEATFKAMMRVDGHMTGRISSSSGTLIVGTNGKVDANIEVAVATIHGAVNGDIIATQRLELGRAARVNGNIQTPTLIIEQGAIFEGSCKMVQMMASQEKAATAKEQSLGATALPTAPKSEAKPEIKSDIKPETPATPGVSGSTKPVIPNASGMAR
jgi:cytoskeletal protein CcmA (bactofilin family)